jgi:dienelactone hydrolase
MRSKTLMTAVIAVLFATALGAQKPTPTPQMDSRGLPLPFGMQPYFKPDVPLGSGPHKAIMATETALPEHVLYYPADLAQLGAKKMPVVIWGNGSCLYAGNRYRQFLTEIASHGYLVITGGPMGEVEQEVGPQSNPVTRAQGAADARPPQANASNVQGAPQKRVTVPMLKQGVDWAVAQNADASSRFQNKLDLGHIVVMGHSCGGGLAVQLATEDPRLNGLGIWFSGAGLAGARGNDASSLQKIKGPILIITGDEKNDIAYANGKSTFEGINHTPIFYGWQTELQHIGTFGAKNAGEEGLIAWSWLEMVTRNDANAAKMFKGASCTLCKDPSWHIQKKKIDGGSPSTRNQK